MVKKIILLILFSVLMALAFDLTSFIANDRQKHYWLGLGSGVSGYSTARIITWNKYSDQPMFEAENKRRTISLLSGIGAAILIGVGKELIWDLALKKGQPELEDFEYTFIGGIGGSLMIYVLDCTFIKRKDKQNIYLYLIPKKDAIEIHCQLRF